MAANFTLKAYKVVLAKEVWSRFSNKFLACIHVRVNCLVFTISFFFHEDAYWIFIRLVALQGVLEAKMRQTLMIQIPLDCGPWNKERNYSQQIPYQQNDQP